MTLVGGHTSHTPGFSQDVSLRVVPGTEQQAWLLLDHIQAGVYSGLSLLSEVKL